MSLFDDVDEIQAPDLTSSDEDEEISAPPRATPVRAATRAPVRAAAAPVRASVRAPAVRAAAIPTSSQIAATTPAPEPNGELCTVKASSVEGLTEAVCGKILGAALVAVIPAYRTSRPPHNIYEHTKIASMWITAVEMRFQPG
eukprot:SAG11_NODE_10533_length_824_cov_1.111724_2_plen_143_part_00